jgi:hypothetical protein
LLIFAGVAVAGRLENLESALATGLLWSDDSIASQQLVVLPAKARRSSMRKTLLLITLLLFSPFLFAQQMLDNDAVVKLVNAGLSEELIVSTINASPGHYDTSPDGLIALKNAGASDKVVSAVVARASAPPPPPVAAPAPAVPAVAAPVDENDPMSPHDPGIYLMTTAHDGSRKMILIERAGSGRQKTANVWGYAFSYGLSKAKIKAEVPGPHAATRTADATPVFYMYFPPTGNLGAADTISSPTQFSLLKLEQKKDHRETAVGKIGIGSAEAGNDSKNTFKFNTEKIRSYAYKVSPDMGLVAGEYAFIATTGMSTGAGGGSVVVFDFGVDGK